MKGRSRPYVLAAPAKTGQSALALAFNDHCDALVATAVIARDAPVTVEPIVVEFLNSQTIIRWTRMTLNL
jgi:predicted aconitase with swiveling domain